MVFLFSDLLLYAFPRSGAVLAKNATIGNSLKNNATMANSSSASGVLYDFGALIHLNEHARFVDVADTEGTWKGIRRGRTERETETSRETETERDRERREAETEIDRGTESVY